MIIVIFRNGKNNSFILKNFSYNILIRKKKGEVLWIQEKEIGF